MLLFLEYCIILPILGIKIQKNYSRSSQKAVLHQVYEHSFHKTLLLQINFESELSQIEKFIFMTVEIYTFKNLLIFSVLWLVVTTRKNNLELYKKFQKWCMMIFLKNKDQIIKQYTSIYVVLHLYTSFHILYFLLDTDFHSNQVITFLRVHVYNQKISYLYLLLYSGHSTSYIE